jgi:hypothetical protein
LLFGWSPRLPELANLRVGYESAGWAERAVEHAHRNHPLFAAAVGVAARGAWALGELSRARSLVALAQQRVPGQGASHFAYPADVLADVALYEGDAAAALAHYDGEVVRARRDGDSIRLVFTLHYVAVCHAMLRTPDAGLPPLWSRCSWRRRRPTPLPATSEMDAPRDGRWQ